MSKTEVSCGFDMYFTDTGEDMSSCKPRDDEVDTVILVCLVLSNPSYFTFNLVFYLRVLLPLPGPLIAFEDTSLTTHREPLHLASTQLEYIRY